MNEIEIKAKIPSAQTLKDKIRARFPEVEFSECSQVDTVYVEDGVDSLLKSWPGKRVCRVREQSGLTFFTLKEHRSNQLDRREVEFQVASKDDTENILQALGFKLALVISKRRSAARICDISVCVDSVEDLGDFVELEKLTDSGFASEIQAELRSLLGELMGNSEYREVSMGYDSLLLAKRGA